MVDEVIVNTIGLIFGIGVAEALGNFAESKIKPGVVITSTSQDKMVAEVANNGPKVALAYGVYMAGKSSSFAKSAVVGSVLSTISDVYWRYKNEGVPYSGYKLVPIETPTTSAPTTPAPTTPTDTEPDIGLLDSYLILNTDTLEDIMEKGRILEEI